MPHTVYLSLGSNLGDREGNLRAAISKLSGVGTVTRVSSWFETEPVEFLEQPWFFNCAVELETELTPHELLDAMLAIEKAMGRRRIQPKGPRLIDLDILLFGDVVMSDELLTIPHPALHERRFVLEPLAEIAPEVRDPRTKKKIVELLRELPTGTGQVRRMDQPS